MPQANLDLKSDRLLLRPFKATDADRVHVLIDNWDVARMLSRVPFPYRRELADEWIARHDVGREAGTDFPFAVTAAGELVGAIGMHRGEDGSFEMGYWFGEPYWGKGYATEAARRLLRFAFEERELDGIAAGHYWENHASGRVLTKLGFRYTHEVMRHCLARGHDVRCLMMRLPREAFVATARAA